MKTNEMKKTKETHKKTKINRKRLLILIGIIVVMIGCGWYLLQKVMNPSKDTTKVKVVDNIKAYGYTLDENETEYYKSVFENLKKTLNETTVNEEKYASEITQLFLSDFFHLDNKISKNDVGGLQFVFTDYKTTFEKLAKESVYQYVENDTYEDREQKLPKVTDVKILNVSQTSFEFLGNTDTNAYVVEANIEYEEDMGYQNTATLTLVHNGNKLEIAKMTK